MGAWAAGSFDNDTACDWSYGLEEVDDLSLVIEAFAQVLESDDENLDSDFACEAIAACEVIARLKGNWGPQTPYTQTTDNWVKAHPMKVPPDLVESAIAVLDRILRAPSELKELWDEGDDGDWQAAVLDLKSRVKADSIAS